MQVVRTRIDRFVEDALVEFRDWYVTADWYGKERDCVNRFAFGFLAQRIAPGAAITDLGQIRLECAVPQPARYQRAAACKDLVVWKDSLATTWAGDWIPTNYPRVVMEWKTIRTATPRRAFDDHDTEWLRSFTRENLSSFGYLVQTFDGIGHRSVDWAKVARGSISESNRRA